MGVGLLEIGVQMRKVLIFSIRLCYRTVSNHPFLVGMVCLLALLYRSFPFLFSALVSMSPVIVCTAILLGTLLSFGQQNAPEIEREDKTVNDILVPLKSGVSCDDASVVEKDESISVERYIDKRWDAAEQPFYEVGRDNRFGDGTLLIEKESRELEPVNSVFDEAARFCYDSGSEQKNENEERRGDEDVLEYQYSPIPNTDDNNLEFDVDNDKSVDSYDSKMVNIGSHPGSPWKGEEEEEEDREEDESLDSGSDRAESLPDASMANIIPMLDELHPLLDEGNPQRVNLSDADFDAEFKHSKLSDSEDEFNDGILNRELETADDENEDDEDEEDIQGDKEEGDRFGITWTEDDQKIIMDLGSSELERNQRLESLIAKRIAQKNLKALAESGGELETADDESEDDEDEEDIQGDKEEGDRFGITWTEDDQKIIMDLGSSELERNQRLESLIAKRKAQKNMKALAERSGELETADDESEDDEDEEDIQGDKEEGDRFGITWTEDDHKLIMDLGSSELERNQRLESLIAKRKAQKNMKAVAERNLLDLGSVDLPFNVAPISTARKNPFDIPDDQNDLRLPPIPGSAPSILLPRRNPFDLPYDLGEEKPDSAEDGFQKGFMTLQPKEPFFRRHESFNVQPSLFSPNKQVQDDIRLRPYFVPERMEIDGPSYTPFQRQLSDLSDSKVSSIPETESSGSVSDLEDKDLMEENIVGKNLDEKDLVDENIIDQHISQELDVMSSIEHVGHVSSFSEEELLELGRNDNKEDLFGVKIEFKQNHEEIHHDENPSLIQEGNVANMLDFSSIETNSRSPSFKQKSNWHSSSSSPSEASEKIFDERGTQWLSGLEERSGHAEEKVISREPSSEKSDVNITTISTDENPHRVPIYDSSPAPLQKHISLSSISSDVRTDSLSSISSDVRADAEMGFSPPAVRAALAFADRESMESDLEINKYTPINEEILATSTTSVPVHKVELLSEDPMDINMQEVLKLNSSEINEAYFDAFTPAVAESVVSKVLLDSKASVGTSEDEKIIELLQDESLFSVFNPNVKASNGVDLMMESVSQSKEPFSTAEEFYLVQQSYSLPPRDHKEVQEHPLIVVETIGEAGLTPTSASVLHKVDEATGEVSQSDIKKSGFDEVEVANHIQGSENHELLLETVKCRGDTQHLIEDTDCIKDVSEELLSELDAVGDFSIKEPGSRLNEFGSESGSSKRVILHKDSSLIENEIEFEGSKVEAGKLHYEVDRSENTHLATSSEPAHHEAPVHNSSSIIDVKDKKKEDSLESDSSSSSSSDSSSSDSDKE
ncbi:probable serine/threonine-protein kinase kinX isoform X2 [Ipomoea triloba]|uniref:probable serine/threonine-protein kinase kinX isoform X2 n=1 Tax=Ipomoea triloba TaxID=35885 RepID=UPI00125E3555|nr:probable serine/threonine-protein kinase kinX isoform X2 [Ipomoea triloba]